MLGSQKECLNIDLLNWNSNPTLLLYFFCYLSALGSRLGYTAGTRYWPESGRTWWDYYYDWWVCDGKYSEIIGMHGVAYPTAWIRLKSVEISFKICRDFEIASKFHILMFSWTSRTRWSPWRLGWDWHRGCRRRRPSRLADDDSRNFRQWRRRRWHWQQSRFVGCDLAGNKMVSLCLNGRCLLCQVRELFKKLS